MVNIGDTLNGKGVYEVIELSNSWELAKTENGKSKNDFRVKIVNPEHPRGLTIKHAHFAIDFFGKLCQSREKAQKLFDSLIEIWRGADTEEKIRECSSEVGEVVGYNIDYFLHALNWILEQEDINFDSRRPKKQKELDKILQKQNISTPEGRKGSELAISLFCDILEGTHPVESFYRTGLRI